MKQSLFSVPGMCCPTEEQIIRNRLKPMAEIDSLAFNLMARELTVAHHLDDEKSLLTALESLNLGVRLQSDARAEAPAGVSGAAKWAMGVSGVAAVGAELLAWASGQEQSLPVVALALLSIVAGGRAALGKGVAALRTGTLGINFLMTLAVIGAVCIGQWPEAAMVTFLFGVAELVEAFSLDRARNAIRGLMEMTPETATVRTPGGEWQEMRAEVVQIGQVVRVRPGQRIPLDGEVTTGASSVNQAPITGESIPEEKAPGAIVFAGSVNERGSFEFRVTANYGQTTLARIIRAVQEAQSQRAPTQRFIDNFARYYTPAVVLVAFLVAVVPSLAFNQPFQPWLYKALVMLVIACPCALVISTPVTVVSGLAAAARRGILVKGGVHLETGRLVRAVALDKTGTLTVGKPAVTEVIALGAQSQDQIMQLAASLETLSEHPVAAAIVRRWTAAGASSGAAPLISLNSFSLGGGPTSGGPTSGMLFVSDFESLTGRGVRGNIKGQTYFLGNGRLARENGVCNAEVEAALTQLENEGKTAVVLSTAREALAVLGVADTPRETSAQAVRELHELGVQTVMLSGDNQNTARAIAKRVGIEDVRGGLLPEDKLAAMDELLAKYGAVAMVGDGINDAPALAKSSIGFAMGAAGTGTAIETADVALMQDDLRKLPEFLRLSRQTARVLGQNIAFSIGIKIVFFALALTGHATLWMAVLADMGGSLLVVFNGLRLLRFRGGTQSKDN